MQRASSAILENDVHLRHSHACGEGAYRRGGWRSVHWVEREYGGTAPCAAFRAAVHCAMHVLCDKHRFVHHVVHAPHTCPHARRRDWRRDLVLHAPPMLVAASGNRLPEQHICMARKHTRTAQAARTMRQTPRRDARQRCRYSRTIAALCGSWEASANGKLLYCVGHGDAPEVCGLAAGLAALDAGHTRLDGDGLAGRELRGRRERHADRGSGSESESGSGRAPDRLRI